MSNRLRKVVHEEISDSQKWGKNGDSWSSWLQRLFQPSHVISLALLSMIFVAGGRWYAVASQVEESAEEIQRVVETIDELTIRIEADEKLHTKELQEIKEKLENIENDLARTSSR